METHTARRTIREIDVSGKPVLVRVDYNVTFHPGTTEISDDTRIAATLPTVRYLVEHGCKVVLCSHLGRPAGRVVEGLRMAPVSGRLSELLGMPAAQAPHSVGPTVEAQVKALPPGGVMMLENLRFNPGEEENSPEFAAALASLAEVYVNDAFGAAHRAHASTAGVARYLPAATGLLMARELQVLGEVLESPDHPFVAVLGGAKVSDKIAALQNLATKVDTMIVGGGMAATFLKAQGLHVGESLIEDELLPVAASLMRGEHQMGRQLLLPEDVVIADEFSVTADHREVPVEKIPSGWRIMDIGRRTAALFEGALDSARTVVWNGPMGVCEWEPFAQGTNRLARALAGLNGATTVVGGGSTADIVAELGLATQMTHVSTGGGASLEFLAGKTLPGVAALMEGAAQRA